MWSNFLVIGLIGLAVGSFLNVCIYRIPQGVSVVTPRSRCGTCETVLRPIDLVPVFSWLWLKGRCAHCGTPVSARYLGVELLTSAVFLGIFARFGFQLATPFYCLLSAYFIVVAFIDIDHHKIHNKSVLMGLLLAVPLWVMSFVGKNPLYTTPLMGLAGSLAGFLVLYGLALVSNKTTGGNGLGYGDVKFFLVVGAVLGGVYIWAALWLMFVCAGVYAAFKKVVFKSSERHLALAPFIVSACLAVVLWQG
ncbi:prepilin peptidase [Fusibacter sp. JL298sf-3]